MAISFVNNSLLSRTSATSSYNSFKSTSSTMQDSGDSLRKLESQERTNNKNTKSVVDQSISYADQLRASRKKAKETDLEKKRLQYSFKKISSQIIRSKTSVTAKKAVQAAKREIQRLKRLKANGEYDEEEVQLAIDHAKAMEKVAKKKVAHLEQEEMIERCGKGSSVDLDETPQDDNEKENENSLHNDADDLENDFQDLYNSYSHELIDSFDELYIPEEVESIEYIPEDAMTDLMSEISDEMMKMVEDLDLSELAESTIAPDPNMSEDDLKMLKIKHRGKEMKEIAEADKEYLKSLMEHEKAKENSGINGPTRSASMPHFETPKITPVISMPGSAAGGGMIAPTTSGGFDVSV